MAINFASPSFTELTKIEKKDIVFNEFKACRDSFEYYLDNYAYIRHPNKGIIKMKAFDFQLDVAVPISMTLLNRRTAEMNQALELYKHKFDYEKWWKNICEENIELSYKIPPEFHTFHRIASKDPSLNDRVDTILLKSRQTGLSTIFEQLSIWHINFHGDVYDLIMSQGDREAIKFMSDIHSSLEEIPAPIRSKRINGNEHEIWLSVTGTKRRKSGIQALPPTTKAGRSYSPNLIILDEFAEYRNAEQVWTAVSMSVSGGGVIVIIATPKGVGNLYHKMWEMTNKSFTITMPGDGERNNSVPKSVFRPHVVHWSQLPKEEFTRRGFLSAVDWYEHMKSKLLIEKGTAGVAQELDLNFAASGNTIDVNVIEKLRANCIEVTSEASVIKLDSVIPDLVVYELPQEGCEYVIGVDPAEGVKQDYSAAYVFKIVDQNETISAETPCVAYFSSNSHSVRQFTNIVRDMGIFYNQAWLNIERNNHGNVLLSYFIEDQEYNPDKILNRYDSVKNQFVKGVKGWNSVQQSRSLLVGAFLDYIVSTNGDIRVPLSVITELKTFVFVQSRNRWEALSGYHDDQIIAYALGSLTVKLLARYKRFLIDSSEGYVGPIDIDDSVLVGSSSFINEDTRKTFIDSQKAKQKYVEKSVFNPDKYKKPGRIEIGLSRPAELAKEGLYHKFVSYIDESDDIDDDNIYDIHTY